MTLKSVLKEERRGARWQERQRAKGGKNSPRVRSGKHINIEKKRHA